MKNPFTGKQQAVAVEEPLTAAEVKAVKQVLKRVNAQGPDEFGFYAVGFDDGGEAEVYAKKLQSSCVVSLRGITPDLSRFLFDLLKAGNWVMVPAMEDSVAITASPGSVTGVPDEFPKIVTCDSAEEVATLLTKGVMAWQKFRDRAMRDADGKAPASKKRKPPSR
jgi:hypothetical protein